MFMFFSTHIQIPQTASAALEFARQFQERLRTLNISGVLLSRETSARVMFFFSRRPLDHLFPLERFSPGLVPVQRLKAREKAAGSEKPRR